MRKSYRRYKRKSQNPGIGKSYMGAKKVQFMINKTLSRNIETKSGVRPFIDGTQIAHNDFVVIDSDPLATTQGNSDSESSQGTRIGDKIKIVGLAFKGMLELNERYSDVTFRIMLIKGAKGDIPNATTMWQNISGNKMLDHFNNERFTLITQKWVKIKAPNTGQNSGNINVGVGAGTEYTHDAIGDDYTTQSRATKLFKIWIPGKKLVRNGNLQYENQSSQPKFFDYHAIIYAYSNYSTSSVVTYYVGRVNDSFLKLYYKDA